MYNGNYTSELSYAYNYQAPYAPMLTNDNRGVSMGMSDVPGATLASIEDVVGTIAITEGSQRQLRYYSRDDHLEFLSTESTLTVTGSCAWNSDYRQRCLRARHLGTMNCLFVDGHVKAMKWQTILGNQQEMSSVRWWTTTAD